MNEEEGKGRLVAVFLTTVETEGDSYGQEGVLFSIVLYWVNGMGLSIALLSFGGLHGLFSGDSIPRLDWEEVRLLGVGLGVSLGFGNISLVGEI